MNLTADDNPRRKKTRCPGGRPACEHCHRLGQTCEYASDVISSISADRLRHGSSMSTVAAVDTAPIYLPASTILALEQGRGPSVPTTVRTPRL
jgi:hypothetical protein